MKKKKLFIFFFPPTLDLKKKSRKSANKKNSGLIRNEFNKFYTTEAWMLDSIYCITRH